VQLSNPATYGGDFAWVGRHYKLQVRKDVVFSDVVFSGDGTLRRPGVSFGVDLRWRWDAAQDRLIIDFWQRGKLVGWRWDELKIKDNTKVVPDFEGVGHFEKYTFDFELLRAPAELLKNGNALSTARRSILNLEPVTRDGRTIPGWAAAIKQKRNISGMNGIGSLFTALPRQALLGVGSYGSVWLARDPKTGECFAVKNMEVASNDCVFSDVALNELDMAEKLSTQPHPCIVSLFATEYFDIGGSGMYMLIMEFCAGGDLQEELDSHVRVDQSYKPPVEALGWIGQIFLAVEHVHTKLNLLIRDLKPPNVVLSSRRCAKLTDFGHGRLAADSPGGEWSFVTPPGTPGYIAPELLSKQPCSYPVDIYSLGVLTWVVFSGGLRDGDGVVPPTAGSGHDFASYVSDWSLLQNALEHPETAKCLLPANTRQVVAAMIQEQPQDRPDCQVLRTFDFFREQCLPRALKSPCAAARS